MKNGQKISGNYGGELIKSIKKKKQITFPDLIFNNSLGDNNKENFEDKQILSFPNNNQVKTKNIYILSLHF